MDKSILDIINREFSLKEKEVVVKELSSITLNHVMAKSEYNLKNTRLSILKLAKGNLSQIIHYSKAAKIDFRDVIMWATQEY